MDNVKKIAQKFSDSFNGRDVPSSLLKLIAFEESIGPLWYSSGFERRIDENKDAVTCSFGSEDPLFIDSLFEFANSSGDGSSYNFWLTDGNDDLEKAPICILDSEGEVSIVAHNIIELLHMISYDSSPSVCGSWDEEDIDDDENDEDIDDEDYVKRVGSVYYNRKYDFYGDEDDSHSEKHPEYLKWLKENFDLAPITDATIMMQMSKKAQDKYQKPFKAWIKKYFDEGDYAE